MLEASSSGDVGTPTTQYAILVDARFGYFLPADDYIILQLL